MKTYCLKTIFFERLHKLICHLEKTLIPQESLTTAIKLTNLTRCFTSAFLQNNLSPHKSHIYNISEHELKVCLRKKHQGKTLRATAHLSQLRVAMYWPRGSQVIPWT